MNKKEIKEYKTFINQSVFKKMFNQGCNNPNCKTCTQLTGFINCNHKFFNPRKEFNELFVNDKVQIFDFAYNNVNHKFVSSDNYEPLCISTNGNVISI